MKKIIISALSFGLVICMAIQGQAQTSESNQSILLANGDSKIMNEINPAPSLAELKDDVDHDYGDAPAVILGFRYMPTFTSSNYSHTEGGDVSTTLVWGHGFGGLIG